MTNTRGKVKNALTKDFQGGGLLERRRRPRAKYDSLNNLLLAIYHIHAYTIGYMNQNVKLFVLSVVMENEGTPLML
jgi:hypothetical protein